MQLSNFLTSLKVAATVSLILLASTFTPYTSTEVPEWKVQVIDLDDQPVANAEVNQSVVFSGREEHWFETQKTDEQGRTMFSAKTIRASLSDRLLRRIRMYRAHYPYGPSTVAWACVQGHSATSEVSRTPSNSAGTIRLRLGQKRCGIDW